MHYSKLGDFWENQVNDVGKEFQVKAMTSVGLLLEVHWEIVGHAATPQLNLICCNPCSLRYGRHSRCVTDRTETVLWNT